jgi:hypothetical protein
MDGQTKLVNSTRELVLSASDQGVREIIINADLDDVPSIKLLPGQGLRANSGQHPTLTFRENTDGIQLSSENVVSGLRLIASTKRRAVWNDSSVEDLGTIGIHSVQAVGRIQILAKHKVRRGHVEVDGLDIIAADARAEQDRPYAYGVYVLQGAFTLWNMQVDKEVILTSDLINLSIGRFGSPVFGSGVFVGGAGDGGGRLSVQRLETKAVYLDGGIAPGTADVIAGGVFVVYGTDVDRVTNYGPVITYGVNDMALDNWGVVDNWIAKEKVTTFGASGIGFVNFGSIRDLHVEAPIETFGQGARGFNVYSGTIGRAEFDRIVTHGDGAVGVQIGQPIGTMIVRRGIETFGASGPSLVKGVVQNLSAIAFSVKPGGSAQAIRIEGGLNTHSQGITPLEQEGNIGALTITGGYGFSDATDSSALAGHLRKTEGIPMKQGLSMQDKFEIFEQLQQHQRSIDNDGSRESAQAYVELYWPDAKFTVHDLRHMTFEGPAGLKRLYDYAHSVFPLHKWSHSVGSFAIDGGGNEATAEWRWIVSWKADQTGTVSTGTYSDKFQKRNGQWRCVERISNVDPNWPTALFQSFVDREKETFRES